MQVEKLMDLVVQAWSMDEIKYPGMKGLSPDQQKLFALKHVFLHQMKMLGEMAQKFEASDHDMATLAMLCHPKSDLKRHLTALVGNSLRNTLRIANLLGISAQEIETQMKNG